MTNPIYRVLGLTILLTGGFAQTGRDIIEKMLSQPSPSMSYTKIEITIGVEKKGRVRERSRVIERYIQKYSNGEFLSKTLIHFLEPLDVRGTGFLSWTRKDGNDEQWLYLPAVKSTRRIALSESGGSFMGTDFTYEDLGSRRLDDDTYVLMGNDTVFSRDCFLIEATPVKPHSVYSKRRLWIDRVNLVAKKIEFIDLDQKLLKVLSMPRHEKMGAYWNIPEMVMENVQTAHKTTLSISQVRFDEVLPGDFFTERYLMRLAGD